jgi:hypothetical protein
MKSKNEKEFIIRSQGEDNFVEVLPHHSLSHVRQLILDEFDEEQLPSKDGFAFRVNGIRVGEKQEAKKCAFYLIESEAVVELVPKGVKRTVSDVNQSEGGDNGNKRAKREHSCCGVVTPFGSKKSDTENYEEQDRENEISCKSSILEGDNDSTVMMPVDLEGKFVETGYGEEEDADVSSSESTVELEWAVTLDGSNRSIMDDKCKVFGKGKDDIGDAHVAMVDSVRDKESINSIEPNQAAKQSASGDFEDNEDIVLSPRATSPSNNTSADRNDDLEFVRTTDSDAGLALKPAAETGDVEDPMDKDEVVEVTIENNPHEVADEAKDKSKLVLSELTKILKKHPDFCSEIRMNELLNDINDIAANISPKTIFGVVGNIGT